MIENGSIITFHDQREFIVLAKLRKEENIYLYLVSNFKPLEIRFAKLRKDSLDEMEIEWILNQQEKWEVMELFQKEYGILKDN